MSVSHFLHVHLEMNNTRQKHSRLHLREEQGAGVSMPRPALPDPMRIPNGICKQCAPL